VLWGSPFCTQTGKASLLTWLGVFKMITAQLQRTRRKNDSVYDELLCGREEVLYTSLKSLGDTSSGLAELAGTNY